MSVEQHLNVILEPRFTEKNTMIADKHKQIVFSVKRDATKHQIKQAIEALFDVSVKAVNVSNAKPKFKKTRHGMSTRQKAWKKAFVTLSSGDIDFTVKE